MAAYPMANAAIRVAAYAGIGAALGAQAPGGNWSLALVAMALGAVAFAGLGLVAAALVVTIRQAQSAVGFLVAVLGLGAGSLFPPSLLPGWAEALAQASPVTHALALARDGLLEGAPWASRVGRLGLLAGLAVVYAAAGVAALAWALPDRPAPGRPGRVLRRGYARIVEAADALLRRLLRPEPVPPGPVPDGLRPRAAFQGLSGLVARRAADGLVSLPPEVQAGIEEDAAGARRRCAVLDLELRRVAGAAPAGAAAPVAIKGPAVALRYDDRAMRPYVDVDLLVPEAKSRRGGRPWRVSATGARPSGRSGPPGWATITWCSTAPGRRAACPWSCTGGCSRSARPRLWTTRSWPPTPNPLRS